MLLTQTFWGPPEKPQNFRRSSPEGRASCRFIVFLLWSRIRSVCPLSCLGADANEALQTKHCKRRIANEELQTKRLPGYATVRQAVDIRAIQLVDESRCRQSTGSLQWFGDVRNAPHCVHCVEHSAEFGEASSCYIRLMAFRIWPFQKSQTWNQKKVENIEISLRVVGNSGRKQKSRLSRRRSSGLSHFLASFCIFLWNSLSVIFSYFQFFGEFRLSSPKHRCPCFFRFAPRGEFHICTFRFSIFSDHLQSRPISVAPSSFARFFLLYIFLPPRRLWSPSNWIRWIWWIRWIERIFSLNFPRLRPEQNLLLPLFICIQHNSK